MVTKGYSYLFVSIGCYSPDIYLFCFCSALNPDSSICMNCCYSPWLFAAWALRFAEDSILYHWNSTANFVIIVNVFFSFCAKISLVLPAISNFVPVGYEGYVKEHVPSKYCCACGGIEDCVIGGANGPCRVVKEDIEVIGGY
jgi:hypothetical protein